MLIELGRWGSRRMIEAREGEIPTDSSLAAALLTSRTESKVQPFSVEVTAGPAIAHAEVSESGVQVEEGADPTAQLFVSGPGLRRLLADGNAEAAVAAGTVTVDGDESLLNEFIRSFHAPLDDSVGNAAPEK